MPALAPLPSMLSIDAWVALDEDVGGELVDGHLVEEEAASSAIDPDARTVEILELGPDRRFVEVLAAAEGTHYVPGCTGLILDLDILWAELDRWAAMQADEITDSGEH